MNTITKEKYISLWNAHLSEFHKLGMDSIDLGKYELLCDSMDNLKNIIEEIAETL